MALDAALGCVMEGNRQMPSVQQAQRSLEAFLGPLLWSLRVEAPMKWPWVSRRAYDLALEELHRLREQNTGLYEHFKRMDRTEHGLGEVPRPARTAIEAMPETIQEYISGFAGQQTQKQMRDQCWRRHGRGEAWASIEADLQAKEKADDEGEPNVAAGR